MRLAGSGSRSLSRALRAVRLLAAVALTACGAAAAQAPTSTSVEVAAGTPAERSGREDAAIADLLSRAELVVVGRASLGACLDGCIGRIEIDEVLLGVASGTISFVSEPPRDPRVDERARIMFLAREGDGSRWRLLLTDDHELGLAPSLREEVEAARGAR
jgi:hypothetical protein